MPPSSSNFCEITSRLSYFDVDYSPSNQWKVAVWYYEALLSTIENKIQLCRITVITTNRFVLSVNYFVITLHATLELLHKICVITLENMGVDGDTDAAAIVANEWNKFWIPFLILTANDAVLFSITFFSLCWTVFQNRPHMAGKQKLN